MQRLPLSQAKFALVDDEYFDELNKHKWYFHHTGYAVRNITLSINKRKTIFLHRQIIPLLDDQYIDHKDLNKLNCQKSNLRITTYALNNTNKGNQKNNKSGYKGVFKLPKYNRWRAYLTVNRKRENIGYYRSPENAARAYNKRALEVWGEHARLNVIPLLDILPKP
jgi:hypothetical protein